jgi:hypothetical protein
LFGAIPSATDTVTFDSSAGGRKIQPRFAGNKKRQQCNVDKICSALGIEYPKPGPKALHYAIGHLRRGDGQPARLPAGAAVGFLVAWQRNTMPGCMRNQNEATENDSDSSYFLSNFCLIYTNLCLTKPFHKKLELVRTTLAFI